MQDHLEDVVREIDDPVRRRHTTRACNIIEVVGIERVSASSQSGRRPHFGSVAAAVAIRVRVVGISIVCCRLVNVR